MAIEREEELDERPGGKLTLRVPTEGTEPANRKKGTRKRGREKESKSVREW